MTKLEKIRQAFADYAQAEGCSCCRDEDKHKEAAERLAKLLNVPRYSDGSGINFNRFATKPTRFAGDEV